MVNSIQEKIHQYYLETEKDGLDYNKVRSRGEYPNALLISKSQYKNILIEMFKLQEDVSDEILFEIKIMSIEGLKVIFTDFIEEPKVIKLNS
jgi:hypothetical protein